MIQLIVNAFVEKDKTGAVVEVLYASSNHEKVRAKYEELVAHYPENYFRYLGLFFYSFSRTEVSNNFFLFSLNVSQDF